MNEVATKTKDKSFLLRFLIIVFCAYMLVTLGTLVNELSSGRETLKATQEETKQTSDRIEEKENLLENSTDEELIEYAARQEGYGYPNEVVFEDTN